MTNRWYAQKETKLVTKVNDSDLGDMYKQKMKDPRFNDRDKKKRMNEHAE